MRGHVTRSIAWLGLGLALGAHGAAAQAPRDSINRDQVAGRWPFAGDGSVRIVDPSGRIRLIGWDVDSLVVSGRGPGRLAAAGTVGVRKLVVTGRAGLVELESQSGAIALRVPATTVADFDLVTIGGSITNRLTAATAGRGVLRFSTGAEGGGAQVTARSFKGSISLDAK